MGLTTRGFVSVMQLQRHYQDHGADFGCADASEYERLADEFLSGPRQSHVHECTRSGGDLARFCTVTEAYGVVGSNGVIRTFYKPIPCISVPRATRAAMQSAGRCHDKATNFLYFKARC
jgi:pyocin large subunit-like protein